MHTGSTAAWAQICTTLCEPGDGVLCEEFTYPSALSTAWPSGILPVPCAMDGEGLTGPGLRCKVIQTIFIDRLHFLLM
jgi:aromatic amino acid aminotransferase I